MVSLTRAGSKLVLRATDQQLYLGMAVRNKSSKAKFGTRNY